MAGDRILLVLRMLVLAIDALKENGEECNSQEALADMAQVYGRDSGVTRDECVEVMNLTVYELAVRVWEEQTF